MRIRFNLDKVFEVSIVLKGLDSAAEVIGGILLLTLSPHFIDHVTTVLTRNELSQDPHDFIATLIAHTGHKLAHDSRLFGGIYLLVHGVIKLFAIVAVLKQKLWAYPLLVVVIFGFICYQVWSLLHKFTIGMLLLTIFDAFIIVLTWLEWQKHTRQLQLSRTKTAS